MEIIARLKEKKLWDEKQKLLDSKCQLEMRMKNIEEAYAQEWAVRDEEIERLWYQMAFCRFNDISWSTCCITIVFLCLQKFIIGFF